MAGIRWSPRPILDSEGSRVEENLGPSPRIMKGAAPARISHSWTSAPFIHFPARTELGSDIGVTLIFLPGLKMGQVTLVDQTPASAKGDGTNEAADEIQSHLAGVVRSWRTDYFASHLQLPHRQRAARSASGSAADDGQRQVGAGLHVFRPGAIARAEPATQDE